MILERKPIRLGAISLLLGLFLAGSIPGAWGQSSPPEPVDKGKSEVPRKRAKSGNQEKSSGVLRGGAEVRTPNSKPSEKDPAEEKRDLVGSLFPIPLGTKSLREESRALYEKAFATANWRYTPMNRIPDPLEKFKATGDERQIPDPRRGGRSNNASDRITNHLLGWLLYGDQRAREAALVQALWLAQVPNEQDHGHVQRHPVMGLAAMAADRQETRLRLLSAFLDSYSRLQNSRFFVDDPGNESWMIGMAGVRPFLRAVGAAHRFVHVLSKLVEHGHLGARELDPLIVKFKEPDKFLERVQDRLLQFCLWRKKLGDQEKRGWQTEPGAWLKGRKVKNWPYLSEREVLGNHVTWFHVGCLWPYEMLVVETHWGKLPTIARLRTEEIATWALEIGYDGGHIGMTGRNLKSSKGTFHPQNPLLQRPFRKANRNQRLQGESAYSVAPALYFSKMSEAKRKQELRRHFRTTKSASYPGEISWATLLVLHTITAE